MAKSYKHEYSVLAAIAIVALLVAGSTMALASTAGLEMSVLPVMKTDAGYRLGLFRARWCGNGKLEYREQCDDGNRVNGDGCSRRCMAENNSCFGRALGERFRAPDGCNTCVCTASGAACTKMACVPRSSASYSSGQKCLASNQCPTGQYCTTEDGDCESACPPDAEVCIQACAGTCRREECRPVVCPDGTRHPTCSADGHVINYFADPCLTSRPRCGDNICQPGETGQAGTCPADCPARPASSTRRSSAASRLSSTAAVSCDARMREFNATVAANDTCRTDADCMMFEQSCPYLTCGVGINVSAQSKVKAAADAYLKCQQDSGEPISCAGCIVQRVACVNNRCVMQSE